MKKFISPFVIWVFGLGIFLTGCQEAGIVCPGTPVPYLQCVFTNSSGAETDSLVVVLTAIDSIIYDGEEPTGNIKIPLKLSSDSTLFHVIFDKDTIDYFLIRYERTVAFDSPECGFLTTFIMDSSSQATDNKVDSIYILNTLMDFNTYDNLQIFY